MSNYYKILCVPKGATTSEITKSYRRLALKWHPDKNPSNVEFASRRFSEICEAYEILSDNKKRKAYDLRGKKRAPPPSNKCGDNKYEKQRPPYKNSDDIFKKVFGTSVYADVLGAFRWDNSPKEEDIVVPVFPTSRSVATECTIIRSNSSKTTTRSTSGTFGKNGKVSVKTVMIKNGKKVVATYENGILKSKTITYLKGYRRNKK